MESKLYVHKDQPNVTGNQYELPVNGQHIDIWLTYYQDITNVQILSKLRTFLSATERAQEVRFHCADDRHRYLVTRAMVRTVLSGYAPLAPNDWIFSTNAHGRPKIANSPDGLEGIENLRFNISHTRGLIALAVTRNRAIGVDVENQLTRRSSAKIANRFFSPEEATELTKLARAQRQERFFEYWTFKEAYIKARGIGLSIPLDKFSFYFPDENTVRLKISSGLRDSANGWSFWQLRLNNEYLLAICAEHLKEIKPTLAVRKTIPTIANEVLEVSWSKTSD